MKEEKNIKTDFTDINATSYFLNGDLEKVEEIWKNKLEETQDIIIQGACYLNLGDINYDFGKFDVAKQELHKALQILKKKGHYIGIGRVLQSLANIYHDEGELQKSEETFKEAIQYFKKENYLQGIERAKLGLADISIDRAEYRRAEDYIDEAMKLFEEDQNKTTDVKGKIFLSYGYLFMTRGDRAEYGISKEYLDMALKIFEDQNNYFGKALCFLALGRFFLKTGKYIKSEEYFNRAINMLKPINKKWCRKYETGCCLVEWATNILEQYYTLSRFEVTTKKTIVNLNEAELMIRNAIEIFDNIENYEELGRAYNLYSKIHLEDDDYKGAIKYCECAIKLFEKIGHKVGIAQSYSNIGKYHLYSVPSDFEKGFEKGKEYLKKGYEEYLKIKSRQRNEGVLKEIELLKDLIDFTNEQWYINLYKDVGINITTRRKSERNYFKPKKIKKEDDDIWILKKWNSFYPLIWSRDDLTNVGGGYFITYGGKGIIIDPGYNFLRIFEEAGFNIADIDCIIITHDHPDHCADFQRIMDLLYRKRKHHDDDGIDIFLNCGSYTALFPYVNNKKDRVYVLEPEKSFEKTWDNRKFSIMATKSLHSERWGLGKAIGLILKFFQKDNVMFKMGITSDTAYKDKFNTVRGNFDDVDILIVHIGTVESFDLDKDTGFLKNHLGIMGVYKFRSYAVQ